MRKIEFINPQEAFSKAIATKILSENKTDSNFVGNFMYMGTKNGVHQFKHIDTRKYGFDYQTIIDATKLD